MSMSFNKPSYLVDVGESLECTLKDVPAGDTVTLKSATSSTHDGIAKFTKDDPASSGQTPATPWSWTNTGSTAVDLTFYLTGDSPGKTSIEAEHDSRVVASSTCHVGRMYAWDGTNWLRVGKSWELEGSAGSYPSTRYIGKHDTTSVGFINLKKLEDAIGSDRAKAFRFSFTTTSSGSGFQISESHAATMLAADDDHYTAEDVTEALSGTTSEIEAIEDELDKYKPQFDNHDALIVYTPPVTDNGVNIACYVLNVAHVDAVTTADSSWTVVDLTKTEFTVPT